MPDIFLTEEFWLAVLAAAVVGVTVGMTALFLITAVTSFFSTIGKGRSTFHMKSKQEYHKRTQQRLQQENGIYENRATLEDTPIPFQDVTDTPCCGEELVFALRDTHHPFSIGLSTILSCLAIAEKEGYVPQLPFEWWNSLRRP